MMKILDRLTELESGGTEGPWKNEADGAGVFAGSLIEKDNPVTLSISMFHKNAEKDGQLIAESRNALPALIEVARAAKENQKVIGAMPWRVNEERDIEFTEVTRSLFRAWMFGPMTDLDEALAKLEALCPAEK